MNLEDTLYTHALAFIAGAGFAVILYGSMLDIEDAKKIQVKRVEGYQPAAQLIKCDRGAVQEVARICYARRRMTEVR